VLFRSCLIVEYIGTDDPMFRMLARGREHLHADLTQPAFEKALSRHFEIAERCPLPDSTRTLYLLNKKP
jgi:hypothetical protein